MSNTFPILLSFTGFVPFILRIAVGLYFIYFFGHKTIKGYDAKETLPKKIKKNAFFILGLIVGIFITVGFYTQIASLLGIAIVGFSLFTKKGTPFFETKTNHIFLFAIFLSLFISGAGYLAFDLPF
ncbi:MAG: putative oxidoreductase [Patescibacteria group bacterium]|jgi:uncharacterized membrane protein YphA (DoxX/SURF4 family)|nr:putative oxidoreductase [Patescibacteria group bacterium]